MNLQLGKLKTKKTFYFILSFCGILLLSSINPIFRGLIFSIVKHPLILIELGWREVNGYIFYHRNYIQKERLEKEVGLLRQLLASANEVRLENERLKRALAFKEQAPYKVITSRVIAHGADSWTEAVVIDKGSAKGIRRGMPVVNYTGLVGRIIETTPFTSKVILISDPGLGVSAIAQRSRQEGLVSGTLGGNLIMRYLPDDLDLQPGDIILTSGLNGYYPKGIPVGTVTRLGKEYSGLSTFAIIKPSAQLSNIEELLVVID